MTVLVIGASGFLGGAIAIRYAKEGYTVYGSYKNNPIVPSGCIPVSIDDIYNIKDKFDIVILAAGNYSLDKKTLVEINVGLTQNISNRFPDSKLIYISSVSVYGKHQDTIKEHSFYQDPTFYGQAKLAGETIISTHQKYSIIRLTYLYGVNMPDNSFLPRIIKSALIDHKITLYGDGERKQDYLHIEDAANLCYLARLGDNGIFLGVSGVCYSNKEDYKILQG